MALIIDDLADLSGFFLVGMPWSMFLSRLQDIAYSQMYDAQALKDKIRENQMLYELGEISEGEYEENNEELLRKLELAERYSQFDLETRADRLSDKTQDDQEDEKLILGGGN